MENCSVLMNRKSSISNTVQLNMHFPLVSWQIQFNARGINMPDTQNRKMLGIGRDLEWSSSPIPPKQVYKVSMSAIQVLSIHFPTAVYSLYLFLFLFLFVCWGGGGGVEERVAASVATISDINYKSKREKKKQPSFAMTDRSSLKSLAQLL